jgi:hypothetical protein
MVVAMTRYPRSKRNGGHMARRCVSMIRIVCPY